MSLTNNSSIFICFLCVTSMVKILFIFLTIFQNCMNYKYWMIFSGKPTYREILLSITSQPENNTVKFKIKDTCFLRIGHFVSIKCWLIRGNYLKLEQVYKLIISVVKLKHRCQHSEFLPAPARFSEAIHMFSSREFQLISQVQAATLSMGGRELQLFVL